LVLLPGTLLDAELFGHQIAHLADVAAITVGDLANDDSVAGMARTVLAAAPPRFALAGLSLGGIVAFEIMRQAPERVTRLALLDTTPAAVRAACRLGRAGRPGRGRPAGSGRRSPPAGAPPAGPARRRAHGTRSTRDG
jgi:pimeloyl-ACP methyl ester carboxylesterase